MKRVLVNRPNEDWICDRMTQEWCDYNHDISSYDVSWNNADVFWLLADWTWRSVAPIDVLKQKKVLTTVHHIVPGKFNTIERREWFVRDAITDAYHVFNERVLEQVKALTKKPVHLIEYWVNDNIFKRTHDRVELRKKYNIPVDGCAVYGSFQRDTEGFDLISPKLEKGPDLLADFLIKKHQQDTPVHVVLGGWRRQYIINRLDRACIPYTYVERMPLHVVNELYQTLDTYAVTARHEGGPQALLECGCVDVPVVSTPVGIAEQVLPSTAIAPDVFNAVPAVPDVSRMKIGQSRCHTPQVFQKYRDLLLSL